MRGAKGLTFNKLTSTFSNNNNNMNGSSIFISSQLG